MKEQSMPSDESSSLSQLIRVDEACQRFEAAWKAGLTPRVEEFLDAPSEAERAGMLKELILLDIWYCRIRNEVSTALEYIRRFPELANSDFAWLEDAIAHSQLAEMKKSPFVAPQDRALPAGFSSGNEGSTGSFVEFPFLAPAQEHDEIGRLGPYRVLKVLGAGGMGVVFEAADLRLPRHVALKAMLPKLASDPSARKRFLREARAAAAIEHDHIVRIFHVGEDRSVPFLAMPLLKGETLEHRLRRQGRQPAGQVLRIGREVAEGLAAAHRHGLIHRDIKPGNIWLEGGTERVKILDFGLVRGPADGADLTQSGAIVGTPAYMAPEQARGGEVDPRSDLFSLGCVLYRMCIDEAPFKGKDPMSIFASLARDNPQAPGEVDPDVPPALSDLVMNLLAKNPDERPASADAVAHTIAVLERGEEGATITHRVSSPSSPARRPSPDALSTGPGGSRPASTIEAPRGLLRRWRLMLPVAAFTALVLAGYACGPAIYRSVVAPGLRDWGPPRPSAPAPELNSILKDAMLLMTFEKDAFYVKDGATYVRDLSGRGNDGLCDAMAFTPEGKAGGGLKCNGKGALRLPVSLFNHQANYTFTAWIHVIDDGRTDTALVVVMSEGNQVSDKDPIFNVHILRSGVLTIDAWNQDRGKGQPDENANWLVAGTHDGVCPYSEKEWVFLAVTLEKGAVSSGLSRVSVDDKEYGLTSQTADSPFPKVTRFGSNLSGVVDEVAVFHRALSVQEIEAIRQQGIRGVPLATVPAALPTDY